MEEQKDIQLVITAGKELPVSQIEKILLLRYDSQIEKRFDTLENRIGELKEMLEEIYQLNLFGGNVSELRDIPYHQAKNEVAEYFLKNDGREIGYEELIENLHLDPASVVKICNELSAEGKIG